MITLNTIERLAIFIDLKNYTHTSLNKIYLSPLNAQKHLLNIPNIKKNHSMFIFIKIYILRLSLKQIFRISNWKIKMG